MPACTRFGENNAPAISWKSRVVRLKVTNVARSPLTTRGGRRGGNLVLHAPGGDVPGIDWLNDNGRAGPRDQVADQRVTLAACAQVRPLIYVMHTLRLPSDRRASRYRESTPPVPSPRSPAPVVRCLKIGRTDMCPFSGPPVERLCEIRLSEGVRSPAGWRNPQPLFSAQGVLSP